ncbi:MAG TPA: DinB family protein [Bauldia sp.]|nr:DinB family protein [Bauldia sp.]
MSKRQFQMMAHYNRWANERLYAASRGLPDAEYRRNRGAFFGSLHGTLSHLLVADQIWMRRFTGDGPVRTKLDEILFEDFDALQAARRDWDGRIVAHVEGLSDADIAGPLSFRTVVRPQEITQPRWSALTHFFNHQTHHRGQAHTMVTMIAGNDAMPSLDLIIFQRETGIGMT